MVHPGDDEKKQVPVAEVKPDSWNRSIRENVHSDDVVTLTKSQLRAIFEAIGQVGALSINDKASRVEKYCGHECAEKKKPEVVAHGKASASQANGSTESSRTEAVCPLDLILPSSSKMSSSEPQQQQQQSHVSTSQQAQQLSPTKSTLSRLEQKRLQWEKEKAEMLDWNPWGKPGAGAPARKTVPVASVAPRTENQLLNVNPHAVPYSSSVPNSFPSCLSSPSHSKGLLTTSDNQPKQESPFHSKPYMSYNCVTQPVKPVPPVFKSSIAFGANDDDSITEDILNKKQQWLRDLENQREEQRLQRMCEQERYNPAASEADWNGSTKNDLDSISISIEATGALPQPGIQTEERSYVRGQGFRMDPVSAAKAEERRQKAQEYQQAIRMQMEEKQRRIQEEKERKKREEEEEERRLAAERARMQAEYEQEQQRLKLKMEMEEKKQKAMLTAVREAQAQAEANRKSRKAQKLHPQAAAEAETPKSSNTPVSPPRTNVLNSPRIQTKDEEGASSTKQQQTATVHPVQCSGDDTERKNQDSPISESSCSKEIGIQTVPLSAVNSEECSGYITNRIITPGSRRIRARRAHAKDFGTQTDINYGKWITDDAESTDQSNTSSIHPAVGKRLTRVQHSKPYKASRHQFGGEMSSLLDRPKWGANQPSKSFVRMTDRDPHFTKRKKLQELRKQHWEREMATQQALRNSRKPNIQSYPPLRSRRVRSSSEGTAGLSSSEFETSNNVRYLSTRRLPQGYNYCSMCGSAEDIDYLRHSPTYSSSNLPSVRQRRDSQSSDNLPSIIGGSEPGPSRLTERFSFPEASCGTTTTTTLPPMRRKWHSQEAFCPHVLSHDREPSPPVPAVHRRLLSDQGSGPLLSPPVHSRRKWSDQESFDLESVALSHVRSHKSTSEESSEKNEKDSVSSAGSSKRGRTPTEQDPLVCPEVVTGRPTPRQDRILQNLSSLREGLLQKQKEIENLLCQSSSSS